MKQRLGSYIFQKAHIFQAHHPTKEADKWQIAIGEEDDFIADSLRLRPASPCKR